MSSETTTTTTALRERMRAIAEAEQRRRDAIVADPPAPTVVARVRDEEPVRASRPERARPARDWHRDLENDDADADDGDDTDTDDGDDDHDPDEYGDIPWRAPITPRVPEPSRTSAPPAPLPPASRPAPPPAPPPRTAAPTSPGPSPSATLPPIVVELRAAPQAKKPRSVPSVGDRAEGHAAAKMFFKALLVAGACLLAATLIVITRPRERTTTPPPTVDYDVVVPEYEEPRDLAQLSVIVGKDQLVRNEWIEKNADMTYFEDAVMQHDCGMALGILDSMVIRANAPDRARQVRDAMHVRLSRLCAVQKNVRVE